MKNNNTNTNLILFHHHTPLTSKSASAVASANHHRLLFIFFLSFFTLFFSFSLFSSSIHSTTTSHSLFSSSSSSSLPPSVLTALLHYTSSSPPNTSMSFLELSTISSIIHSHGPTCNLLIFGLTHESLLWRSINFQGRTVFVDESPYSVSKFEQSNPGAEAFSPSFQTKTHFKSYSSPSSVVMLHEQTATPIVNSRHLTSLSRHFPASVLSQEPREESRHLSHALTEDRTSQLTLERRQFDELVSSREDEKFEQQLLHSAGLWNLLISPLTAEKQLPAVVSPLEDAEPCDVVALAQKALSAVKQAALLADDSETPSSDNTGDSLSTSSSMSLPEEGTIVRSKRQLERRAKNRRAPKSNDVDDEGYVPQKVNAKKKMKQGFDTDDALQLFLWGPETKQLLTAKEEAELISHIQHLIKLEMVKTKLESQNGCEPTIGEWAEAMGLSSLVLKSEIHRGRSSREKLITANLRLVVHIAKQYQNRGLNFQDLLQEGSMGLMKSVEKFKPQSGCRFATYAYWWIRQSIRKSIFQNSRTIRLPENVYMLLGKVSEARKTCVQEGNYHPSKDELASHVRVSTEKLDKLLYNTRTPLSMQQPIWADQDTTFQEITPDSGIETPTMSVGKQMMRNHVRNLLNVLSPKERRIIKLRFGIDGGKQRSLSEIGEIYGLSKERVRQLESRALYRLKQNMNSHGLHAYADLLV